jgi:hypothetical protein
MQSLRITHIWILCGMGSLCGTVLHGSDLLDGWPWQNRWTGKGGSEGNWILHLRIPFTQSLRITAQVNLIAGVLLRCH